MQLTRKELIRHYISISIMVLGIMTAVLGGFSLIVHVVQGLNGVVSWCVSVSGFFILRFGLYIAD